MKKHTQIKVSEKQQTPHFCIGAVGGSASYSIEQFPKNKDLTNFSEEQKEIRKREKKYKYGKKYTCKSCGKTLAIKEFYVKDKKTGRRSTKCRDCQMKGQGIIEIGKGRFALKIAEKGFRRCSNCKSIKPLEMYSNSKNEYLGKANICKECYTDLHREYCQQQQEQVGDFYVKQYGLRKGIVEFTEEIMKELRNEIEAKREPKYFLDGKGFLTISDFARYVEAEYGLPITMTEKRIHEGKTEEECKLSESEMRSRAYTKGMIKVTDTITGEVFYFKNTKDKKLLEMFSSTAITRCIQSGKKTGITSLSKYKNPCTIVRV
jgi:NAD-dependent SIR2 family protein deacetylase